MAWAAVLFSLSSTQDVPGASWIDRIPAEDKLVHVGLYAVLGGLLARGRRHHSRRLRRNPSGRASIGEGDPWLHAALILVGALYGASDEWHQSFVAGRDATLLDWVADLCRVTLGYWVHSVRTTPPLPKTTTPTPEPR